MNVSGKAHTHWSMNDDMKDVLDAMVSAGLDLDYRIGPDQIYLKIGERVIVIHDAATMTKDAYTSNLVMRRLKGEL